MGPFDPRRGGAPGGPAARARPAVDYPGDFDPKLPWLLPLASIAAAPPGPSAGTPDPGASAAGVKPGPEVFPLFAALAASGGTGMAPARQPISAADFPLFRGDIVASPGAGRSPFADPPGFAGPGPAETLRGNPLPLAKEIMRPAGPRASAGNAASLAGHAALTAGSFIPGPVGSLAAFGDAGLSLKEGDYLGAGISGLAGLAGIISDAGLAEAFLKGGRAALEAAIASHRASRPFRSLGGLKDYLESAGPGTQWHHIVEKSQIHRFGPERIHSLDNMVAVPEPVHRQISAFYSKRPKFAEGKTVREWLRDQSFEQQHQFGREALIKALRDHGHL